MKTNARFPLSILIPVLGRTQAIHIDVLDVDEPPAFLNEPKPFHGVVPFEPPIGFQVYKFLAKDENGDGDDNVEYRLINTERKCRP